jgi:hypothetical protein
MSQQLDLFPRRYQESLRGIEEDIISDLKGELNTIDEIFISDRRLHFSATYFELLKFIARFPQYSAFNCFLMYTQNPSASCVATARTWARKYRRKPAAGARPLIILAPMAPVRFVFDIKDTEGQAMPDHLVQADRPKISHLAKVYEKTLHNCNIQGIYVHDTILDHNDKESAARISPALRKKYRHLKSKKDSNYLILINKKFDLTAKYSSLVYELGHIFSGHLGIDANAWWPERQGLSVSEEEIEAISVAYLVAERRGLLEEAQKYLVAGMKVSHEIPPISLNAVLQAVSYIEDMGKSHWRNPKKRSRY